MRKFAILAATIGMAAQAMAGSVSRATPTNDASVSYQWSVEQSWRPMCSVRLADEGSRNKRVTIEYHNLNGARVDLIVRMNAGDPQERLISGCMAVDQVMVTRN